LVIRIKENVVLRGLYRSVMTKLGISNIVMLSKQLIVLPWV